MPQTIIIANTEEPGTFDRTSNCAIVSIDPKEVYRWQVLAQDLAQNHEDFSELRLSCYNVDWYEYLSGDETFLTALEAVADSERDKAAPTITHEQVKALRASWDERNYFVWPSSVEFDLVALCNAAATVNGEEQSEDEPETLDTDVSEVVLPARTSDFFMSAYIGDQPVQTVLIDYDAVLQAVA